MPAINQLIQFKYGLQNKYDQLAAKDTNTIYFTSDKQRLFVGDIEYTRPVGHGTALPQEFLPPDSLFVVEGTGGRRELYFSKDGAAWDLVSVLPATIAEGVVGANTAGAVAFGGTIKVPKITYDARGNITAAEDIELTLPSETPVSITATKGTGDGNAVTEITADGDTITYKMGKTFAEKSTVDDVDGRVTALEGKPAATITATQITNWDGEVGAKAAAKAAQTAADGKVAKNADIEGGTHTKITYDAKGLVTGGADLAVADIPDLTLAKITDAGTAAAKAAAVDAIVADSTDGGLVSAAQVATFVKGQVADLSGAMHFKGIKESLPADTTGYAAGDVIIVGNKEYVCGDDAAWHELGDESIYAVAGNIKNKDIASDAAIDQSKIAGLVDDLAAKATPKNIEDAVAKHVTDNHKVLTLTPAEGNTVTYDGSAAKSFTLDKGAVGLGNVDNTADAEKTVASAGKLTTARTIALSGAATGTATSFDGSDNITIPVTAVDGTKVTGVVPKAAADGEGNNIAETYFTIEAAKGKQDTITFNTAYNAETNKAATMADIQSASLVWQNI